MKIDRRCISHDMISLMKDYDILRGINRKDISIDELLLLLSLSTHIRNKVSKFSHTSTGKTMSDWDCFHRVQDKIGISGVAIWTLLVKRMTTMIPLRRN